MVFYPSALLISSVFVIITLISYADDISAVIEADTEAEIQLAVDLLMEEFLRYFSSAGLSMNPSKSELIVFRRGRQNQELTVQGQPEASKIKLLAGSFLLPLCNLESSISLWSLKPPWIILASLSCSTLLALESSSLRRILGVRCD